MSRVVVTTFLFLYSFCSLAQNGIVLDALTKKGIAFATVISTKTHMGVYTTEDGKFTLSLNKNDSVQVSCIGYEKVTKAWSFVKDNDTILLLPIIVQLSEIKVSSLNKSKFIEQALGLVSKKSNALFSGTTGLEFAVFISNRDKCLDCYINKLCYQIKKLVWIQQ